VKNEERKKFDKFKLLSGIKMLLLPFRLSFLLEFCVIMQEGGVGRGRKVWMDCLLVETFIHLSQRSLTASRFPARQAPNGELTFK
jgi:hypothetical protein